MATWIQSCLNEFNMEWCKVGCHSNSGSVDGHRRLVGQTAKTSRIKLKDAVCSLCFLLNKEEMKVSVLESQTHETQFNFSRSQFQVEIIFALWVAGVLQLSLIRLFFYFCSENNGSDGSEPSVDVLLLLLRAIDSAPCDKTKRFCRMWLLSLIHIFCWNSNKVCFSWFWPVPWGGTSSIQGCPFSTDGILDSKHQWKEEQTQRRLPAVFIAQSNN